MAVFEVVEGDITKLEVDAIVNAAKCLVVGRRRRGRRDSPRGGTGIVGSVQKVERLPHGRSENHPRLPAAGEICDSHRRAGLVRRTPQRSGQAGGGVSKFPAVGARTRHPQHRLPLYQHRRVPFPR